MQTLWSRIAQTGLSCHCPSCVSAGASGVARRTTNAAGRRPVRWALSSTFVYSGIFAAAATTDAGFKQRRRDQWDRAIADIKHDLDQPALDKTNTNRLQKEEEEENEETVRYKPLFDDPQEVVLEEESYLDRPAWPTNTGIPLRRGWIAPNSIYAGPVMREKGLVSRWTTKKMRTVELSVDKLILRMLLHLEDIGARKDIKKHVPESCLPLFGAPTRHLQALLLYTNDQHNQTFAFADAHAAPNDLPRQHRYGVTYKQDDLGEFHRTAQSLNGACNQLFEKQRSGRLSHEALVAKVAYNLYVSSAPPSLDCWNTLLCGFMESDSHTAQLVEPILMAIKNANVRMNETTMKASLKYFIMIDSPTRFSGFVERMCGLNGGLALTKPDINITDTGRPRLFKDEITGKVYQKPYPTPGVFEMLVRGVLHFVGFDAALRVCKEFGHEGWGLSIRGLTPLLDDRARHADYEAGCQVWDLIKRLQRQSRQKGQPEKLFAQTYSAMLRLCSACNEMTRFDEVLREARAAKYGHQELLGLFRQEMHAEPGVRQVQASNYGIQRHIQDVTREELEYIEQKEPEIVRSDRLRSETDENMSAQPPRKTPIPRFNVVDAQDWMDMAHTSDSSTITEHDESLASPTMLAARK